MVYARRQTRPKPRTAAPKTWPAPVSGWVSNRALAEPQSIDGPGAAILDNFFPQATGVFLRRGKARYATLVEQDLPVESLFTYHSGTTERLFAANSESIYDISAVPFAKPQDIGTETGDLLGDGLGNTFGWDSTAGLEVAVGYTSGDWSTIQFATTGGVFLIGVNGADEGFVFDGDGFYPMTTDGISSLGYDAEVTPFTVGETVTGGTSGATGVIVRVTTDTLYLRDVTGAFVDNETITSAGGEATANGVDQPYINGIDFGSLTSADMSFVWAYKSRLYFVEKESLTAWYLPVDSISGTAESFPMGGVFANGGSLLFGQRWSLETGGSGGLSDQNIFVTTEGEVAIYQGNFPGEAATWSIVGVYRIGAPLGKRAYIRGGGDLAIATTVGLVPLSKAISLDVTALNIAAISYKIADAWSDALQFRGEDNWQAVVWPEEKMALVAPPDLIGSSSPVIFISNTETGAWSRYTNWQGLCFAVFRGRLYFGSPDGEVYQANSGGFDDERPYTGIAMPLFDPMGTAFASKVGKMARARVRAVTKVTDRVDILADFRLDTPAAPAATPVTGSNQWDSAVWGASRWDATQPGVISQDWRSSGGMGYSIAPCYQVTSGSSAPVDVELIDLQTLHTTTEVMG